MEGFFVMCLAFVIAEMYRYAFIEERQFPETIRQRFPFECTTRKNRVVWEEGNFCSGLFSAFADHFKRFCYMAARKFYTMDFSATFYFYLHPIR